MNVKTIMVGVVTMLVGLIIWEMFVKKMVVKSSFEAYTFDSLDELETYRMVS